jgi:hypothetical protein
MVNTGRSSALRKLFGLLDERGKVVYVTLHFTHEK